jgi:hypothetical protein
MSLIFAAQLTAVATVALAALALAAAIVAGIALSKQSRQLAILAKQDDRDIADRHRSQATQVYTFVADPGPGYAHPRAENGSDFPVYDAQLWQAGPGGLSDPADIGMIPPGARGIDNRSIHYQDALANTVLTFRRPPVLRDTQLPIHRRQTRHRLLRRPRHAHQRRTLDACRHLIKPQRSQLPDQLHAQMTRTCRNQSTQDGH